MNLHDPRLYEREIDRLHEKHLFKRTLYDLRQDDVALARIVQKRRKVAKLLARAVERGEYTLEPGVVREIEVEGKIRAVVAYGLTDTIVRSTVSTALEEAVAPLLSDRLYSYRAGVSWLQPSADLAAYVRAHRRARPDARTRGLYVLRRDIDSYTDSIPVDPRSALWTMTRNVLGTIADFDWTLVEQTIRPELKELGGGYAQRLRGVPTGQPVSCTLFNFYLHELDRLLAGIEGGFYARYSDDILFAHPDAEVAQQASDTLAAHVAALGLRTKAEKEANLYLTGAGRGSESWPATRGTTTVPFVGTTVSATGTVALNRKKLRGVLRDVERRALRAARAAHADERAAGRAVCSVVNAALAPGPSPFQQASASLLSRAVTDRGQLAQVDYWLARMVVRAVTGDRGVRSFRRVAYKTVREDWGLVSLLHRRNRYA